MGIFYSQVCWRDYYYRAMLHRARLWDCMSSVWPSVCPSVCNDQVPRSNRLE